MSELRKYTAIALVQVRSHFAYVGEVTGRIFFLGVILYIFLCLWRVTYGETGSHKLGGLTLAEMLWYLCMTESIMLSAPRIAQGVDEDVRSGALAVKLTRPLSYPLDCLARALGERAVRFAINALVGAGVTLLLIGVPGFSLSGAAAIALALPLAFLLDFLANFLIGLGAFWLEDTSGLLLLYSRVTMIAGGMLIPLDLLPDSLQMVARALPFASVVYGPAHLFVRPDPAELCSLLVRQGLMTAVLALTVWLVYSRALKRVFANGG